MDEDVPLLRDLYYHMVDGAPVLDNPSLDG
jgi:hypothetical protein